MFQSSVTKETAATSLSAKYASHSEAYFAEFLRQVGKGNTRGYFYVAAAYIVGTGTPQNYEEALKWMRQAAEFGLSSGIRDLGLMLQLGQGTPVDRVEAQKWYYIDEAMHDNSVNFNGSINANYMTDDQLAEAHTQADAWLAARD